MALLSASDDERTAFLTHQSSTSRSTSFDTADTVVSTTLELEAGVGANADDLLLEKLDGELSPPPLPARNRRPHGRLRRLLSWLRLPRRTVRGVLRFVFKWVLAVVIALIAIPPLFFPSYLHPPAPYRDLVARCQDANATDPAAKGCANTFQEKVFISVSLYDVGGGVAGGAWGDMLVDLIHLIGPHNVFLSIYENDSGPEGAMALEKLKPRLHCRHEIVVDESVPLKGFPNVTLLDGTVRVKRLAYLTELRNRALRPLDTFGGADKIKFDKVLFLNDVLFRPLDAAQLLFTTNFDNETGRARYLSACAIDYRNPFIMYDVFAQRDADGYSNGVPIFPIFPKAGAARSRTAMLNQQDAVPVSSCWGGMVAMQAAYVQNRQKKLPDPDFQVMAHHVLDPDSPSPIITAPIRFRYEPEPFVESCECCLIHADAAQLASKIPGAETGVFVNPYVRVAYKRSVMRWLRPAQHWERLLVLPAHLINLAVGLPKHNPHRTVREGDTFTEEVWDASNSSWVLKTRTGRAGMFCALREMQVFREKRLGDINWERVLIPEGSTLDFPARSS